MCSGYVLKIASAFVFVAIFLFVVGSSKVLNVKSVRLTITVFLFIFFLSNELRYVIVTISVRVLSVCVCADVPDRRGRNLSYFFFVYFRSTSVEFVKFPSHTL